MKEQGGGATDKSARQMQYWRPVYKRHWPTQDTSGGVTRTKRNQRTLLAPAENHTRRDFPS